MEVKLTFIIVSVALLLNLVQMQTKYVTWYDYSEERFIHKFQPISRRHLASLVVPPDVRPSGGVGLTSDA